jgi:hypothetical protein
MIRSLLVVVLTAFALAFCASAWAGSFTYYGSSSWVSGQGGSSSFSSTWMVNAMSKNAPFDSTITFIDNVSYSWHSTLRGPGAYLSTHWFASNVKKGHCRANVAANTSATCGVQS